MARTPEDPKSRVLAVALELFGERGYGGTSLQAIGDRLSITKAAVYYHYRAKVALLAVLAEPLLSRMDAVLDRAPASWSPDRCGELLANYLEALIGARVLAKVLISDPTASDHPAAVRMLAQRRRLRNLLVSPGGDKRVGKVQASCALGAIDGAALDFADTQPARHRATILDAAMAALLAVPGQRTPTARRG